MNYKILPVALLATILTSGCATRYDSEPKTLNEAKLMHSNFCTGNVNPTPGKTLAYGGSSSALGFGCLTGNIISCGALGAVGIKAISDRNENNARLKRCENLESTLGID